MSQEIRRLGEIVTSEMADRGLSQRAMADLTGIHQSTLQRRLASKSPFRVTELRAIAGVFGVTVSDLMRVAEDAA